MNINTVIFFISLYSIYFPYHVFGSSPQNILEGIQKEINKLVEIAKPSVVTISSKSSHSYTISKENGILSFFKNNVEEKTILYNSICSGLIYNKEGYIITKSTGVDEYEEINVISSEGIQYKPTFIGQDQETGITVLKIEDENIYPARIGCSEEVTIGSWVTIIGNSMGISPSVSFGVVSGILSNGLVQISAIVSPGNSGSPVFDMNGQVIGILAAQVEVANHVTEAYDNNLFTDIGLAFPINKTCSIVDEIIKSYEEQVSWIGIQLGPDSSDYNALEIINVIPNSPAEKAGLKKDDILIKYNNIMLTNSEQLGNLIRNTIPGFTVPICFLRGKTLLNVFVSIEKRKPFPSRQTAPMKICSEGYYYKTLKPVGITPNFNNVSKLQYKIEQLEKELFQLKSKLNKDH